MNGQQYNELFFEQRMSYIGHLPTPAPAPAEIWRRVNTGATRTYQVSNRCGMRSVLTEALLYGGNLKAIEHTANDYYDACEAEELRAAFFPLEREVLWEVEKVEPTF